MRNSSSRIVYQPPEKTGDELLDAMLELQAYRDFKERHRGYLEEREKRRKEIRWLLTVVKKCR